MKKIFALLLAIVMVMGLATVASATTPSAPEINDSNDQDYNDMLDQGTTFTKAYDVLSGTAPAEDFEFEVEYKSYKDQYGAAKVLSDTDKKPAVTLGKASFVNDVAYNAEATAAEATATAAVTIEGVDECALGVYTYEITELPGDTAGVNYVAKPVYLVVTVLRDEADDKHYVAAIHYETAEGVKTTQTINTYEAGSLTVTKTITGNMADLEKQFPIKVTLTPEAGRSFDDYNATQIVPDTARTYTFTQDATTGVVTVTFTLADGETATFTNIPDGTIYTVEETDLDGYTQTKAEGGDNAAADADVGKKLSGTVNHNVTDNAAFTNELKSQVDTGIVMDSVPFVVMAVIAVLGLAAFTAKKRVQE